MLDTLAAQLTYHQAHLNHRPLYLACSGGRDSLSLAFACYLLFQNGQLASLPTLIHINHRLQVVSDSWARQVADFAERYGFTCHCITLTLSKNDEKTARDARYQAFFELMVDNGVLLLAHHADDQAETLLMRLINGAGVTGLAAMAVWQDRQVGDKSLSLFRPMLSISRESISDFASLHHLPYVDDPTNTAGDNHRAIIRTQLLPILKKLNPKAQSNIARSAFLLGEAQALLEKQTNANYQRCLSEAQAPFFSTLDIAALSLFDLSEQRQLIRAFIKQNAPYPPSLAMSERVLGLCHRTDANHQSELFWQSTPDERWVLVRYRQYLYRYRADVWAFLCGENADFYLTLPDDTDICLQSLSLTKKHRQRLAIPAWLSHHLWVGTVDGISYVLTLGRCMPLDGSCTTKVLPKMVICENLR